MRTQDPGTALDDLWNAAPRAEPPNDPPADDPPAVPAAVRRYLEHAIAPGTPPASAVRLRMHGHIRRHAWIPFTAEQVIRTDGEMLWQARLRLHGIPVDGFDRVLGGQGAMQWKLLGVVPLVEADGPDITRSALGRIAGEFVWLPWRLCRRDVRWTAPGNASGDARIHARFAVQNEETELALTISDSGALQALRYPRWGNPDGGAFQYAPFGGIVEAEAAFGGCTIPTRLRIGWHTGTPRFETEGEFFRVTIDEARFR